MNKIFLQGRLTKNVEVKRTADNLAIASYTLAVSRIGGKNETDFINCKAFGKTAEFASKYLEKGMLILVNGRLQISKFEKDGVTNWFTDVIVNEHYFCENKKGVAKESDDVAGFQAVKDEDIDNLPF